MILVGLVFMRKNSQMNKSEKIIKETGITRIEKYINVKLENETDTFEVLSLRIDTKEAYRDFDADYGVLVGRVLANDGIGIPNVKVSVFIPLTEDPPWALTHTPLAPRNNPPPFSA